MGPKVVESLRASVEDANERESGEGKTHKSHADASNTIVVYGDDDENDDKVVVVVVVVSS